MLSFHAKGYRAYIPGGPVKLVTGSKEHPVSLVSSVFFFVLFRSICRFYVVASMPDWLQFVLLK
jgi:hypothetical protein